MDKMAAYLAAITPIQEQHRVAVLAAEEWFRQEINAPLPFGYMGMICSSWPALDAYLYKWRGDDLAKELDAKLHAIDEEFLPKLLAVDLEFFPEES